MCLENEREIVKRDHVAGAASGSVWVALLGNGPGVGKVCVCPEVDLKGFGLVRRFEDRTPSSLVPIRIGEEGALVEGECDDQYP